MTFSKMKSRFLRSRASSSGPSVSSEGGTLPSTIGSQVSSVTENQTPFSASASDMSEKIPSFTEPWPTTQRTPLSTSTSDLSEKIAYPSEPLPTPRRAPVSASISDMSENIASSGEPWRTPQRTTVSPPRQSPQPSPPSSNAFSQSSYTPFLPVAPTCNQCGHQTRRGQVALNNHDSGNAGRPCYNCTRCGHLVCFDDDRGVDEHTPRCNCGRSSRRLITKKDVNDRRRIFYKCASGSCKFYEFERNGDGSLLFVGDNVMNFLVHLRVI